MQLSVLATLSDQGCPDFCPRCYVLDCACLLDGYFSCRTCGRVMAQNTLRGYWLSSKNKIVYCRWKTKIQCITKHITKHNTYRHFNLIPTYLITKDFILLVCVFIYLFFLQFAVLKSLITMHSSLHMIKNLNNPNFQLCSIQRHLMSTKSAAWF